MNKILLRVVMMIVLWGGARAVESSPIIVARVLGKAIRADSVGFKLDAQNRPIVPPTGGGSHGSRNALDVLIMTSVGIAQDLWLTEHNLHASAQELREYQSFMKRSITKSVAGDKKQLAEFERQLKGKGLPTELRVQREQECANLRASITDQTRRIAQEDTRTQSEMADAYGRDIDRSKFYQGIYSQYGGDVNEAGSFGLVPVDAINRLMLEHNSHGKIEINDPAVKAAFWQRLARKSPTPVPKKKIDWTPMWKK